MSERGLLSAALDPTFATTGTIYVYAHASRAGVCANTLSKFTMSGGVVSPLRRQVLIDNIAWTATNHNGGTVEVGRDGFLYLSVGEGADTGAGPESGVARGQDPANHDDRSAGAGQSVPHRRGPRSVRTAGQSAAVCEEIYALGLRNPFRTAFDPNSATTRFRINDVGAGTWEEVDDGIAGANYGWPTREGPCPTGQTAGCSTDPNFTEPRTAYPRTVGTYIVGGAFVPNGWWGAAYDGGYLFADGSANQHVADERRRRRRLQRAVHGRQPQRDDRSGVRRAQRRTGAVLRQQRQRATPQDRRARTRRRAGGGPGIPRRRRGARRHRCRNHRSNPFPGAHAFTAYPAAQRVLDRATRIGGPTGRLVGGQPRTVALGVPAGASAALVNFTLDNGSSSPEEQCRPPSFLVAWKPGAAKPATSNANVGSCDVAANTAVVQVDGTGAIVVEVYADVHVIIDVLGYYTPAAGAVTAGRFQARHARSVCSTAAPARRPATTTRAPTTATPRSCASPWSVEAVCRPPRRPCRSP